MVTNRQFSIQLNKGFSLFLVLILVIMSIITGVVSSSPVSSVCGTYGNTGGTITTNGSYTIHTFNTSGTFYFVACNTSIVKVECWGGGGRGHQRSGGGGGAYAATINVSVVTGGNYTVYVGGTSSFNSTTVVAVVGADGAACAGGAGGSAASCTGTIRYSGGDGTSAGGCAESGGGGSAGPDGPGLNHVALVGGAGNNGSGGAGGGVGYPGIPSTPGESNPLGGGGGGFDRTGGTPGGGAGSGAGYDDYVNGAPGQVVITCLTVNFQPGLSNYALTYSNSSYGTLSGNVSQCVVPGENGSAVTAIPNDCCHFINWSDGSTQNPRTDTNVSGDISVIANFATTIYTFTYSSGIGGHIVGSTPQSVSCGNNGTTVSAVADAICYNFVNWSDGNTSATRIDLNASANLNLVANFVGSGSFSLNYSAGPNGYIVGSNQTVSCGETGSPVIAASNVNYHFVNWSDGNTSSTRTDSNVTSNISVTANFAGTIYYLNYSAGSNGNLSGVLSQVVASGTNGSAIGALPDPGFIFQSWSDGSIGNPRVDTLVTNNISVTASFGTTSCTLTTGAISGIVTDPGQPGAFPYSYGDNVTLNAIPATSNCTFIGWLGDVSTIGNVSSNSTYIMMYGSYSITAYFNNSNIVVPTPVPSSQAITTNLSEFNITSVQVFNNFRVNGDQLIVAYVQIAQYPDPPQNVLNYVDLDVYYGSVLKARGKVPFWGHSPASIYLAPGSTLIWKGNYTVNLHGVPYMWTTDPVPSLYTLTSTDWIGSDLTQLDYWVVTTAKSMDVETGTPGTLTTYVTGYGTVLSSAGCEIFTTAIPNLVIVRPDLCSISIQELDPDSIPSDNLSTSGTLNSTVNFGSTIMTAFNNLGAYMGVSGGLLAGVFWFVLIILVAGIGTSASGSSVVGTMISLPILFIGNYLGVISLALLGVIGTLCVLYLLRSLWLEGQ